MRGGRVAIVVVFVVALGLFAASGAQACSCARRSAAESLRSADAAVVGRLLQVTPRGPDRAAYRYRVLRVYKGGGEIRRGASLVVLSGRSSAACALPTRRDRAYGLFLLGVRGRWASGICGVISPRRLRAAARQQPPGREASPTTSASCAG